MVDDRIRRMPRVTRAIWNKLYTARKKQLKAQEYKLIHAVHMDRSERLEIGKRQLEILDALNRGERRKHIAKRLRMKFGTVHASVKNALLALKANSVKEALERYRSAAIDHRMRRSF